MSAPAIDVLTAIYAAGGTVRIAGEDRLKVSAPAPLPNALMERLRAVKPDVRSLLSAIPASWIAGVASLDAERPPPTIRPEHWFAFVGSREDAFSMLGRPRRLISAGPISTCSAPTRATRRSHGSTAGCSGRCRTTASSIWALTELFSERRTDRRRLITERRLCASEPCLGRSRVEALNFIGTCAAGRQTAPVAR